MKKWAKEDLFSVLESLLFTAEKPIKVSDFLSVIGESCEPADIKKSLEELSQSYQKKDRGVELNEVAGGYQLVTKNENKDFIQRFKKQKPFHLTKASLEVLSIIAYQQPCTRSEINQIRRTDSGHILRKLMDRSLVAFAGQSDQPGKPMTYKTTQKFLEVYGLKNLKSLPSLEDIKNEFLPEDSSDHKVNFNFQGLSHKVD